MSSLITEEAPNPSPSSRLACAFTKQQRLLNARDFKHVFDHCEFRASHANCLILGVRQNDNLQPGRLGVIVAKKNIRLAHDRNRVKRLIRESFRLHQHYLMGIDAIVLARRGMDQNDNKEITDLLSKLWRKIQKKSVQIG